MIEQADAADWLRSLAPRSVDLVVTDPAYESLEKHRAIGTTTRLKKAWFPIFPNARFEDLLVAMWGALKSNAHAYVICDPETLFVIRPLAERCGFTWWGPLVWDKMTIGMGYHYRRRYEFVCFLEKGKRPLNDLGVADVIEAKAVRGGYPTEKPAALLDTLIRQSSSPGELVVDPFAGSGSTGAAARGLGRRFRGCDVDEHAVQVGNERLRDQPTAPGSLTARSASGK